MASLRDTFSFADPGVSQQGLEELQVQNMGTLRKNYAGGDIGTDANAAAAQLSALRANGQHAEADALQTELGALQQRRGLYAPEIGGVENIGKHGSIVGDAATWALENIGQGAASMQDPILATTAMNAGGRLLEKVPHKGVQMAGKALGWGAPAVAYGMNHEQLKGEFVQNAMRDPELMARTSWQDLNQTANVQALGGAALDTVLPAVLGRQLVGKAGMAALGKMAPTSFGGRTLAAMGFEGATEVGQNVGSQIGLGHLNPNRITSDDFMDNVNAGLGGMVGAGPLAAVGAAAEGGHQRLGGVADALGKKAGDTVDLATGAVDSAKEKGRGWWDRLTGGKEAEDLQGGGDGAAPAGFKLSPEERSTLNWAKDNEKRVDEPGFDEEFQAQEAKRSEFTVAKLAELAESDDKAADILERAGNAANPTEQIRVLSEGSDYLLRKHDLDNLDQTGRSLPSKGAELAGRAAKGIVKGAAKVAGDVISGAARGLAGKKNLQADEGGSTSYTLADWEATQASRRSAAKQALASTGPSARKAEQTPRMNLAARQAAEFARTKYQGKEGLARMASHTAFELIDASRDFRRSDVAGTQPGARNARLGRVADTMRRLYGAEDAMKMADTIASIVGQDGNKYLTPAAEYVKAEIQRLETPEGRIQAKQERQELAGKLASLVPPQRENFLLDKGINIRGQDADHFVRLLEKLADGTAPRDTRQELNRLFGAATVNNLLAELNQQAIATGKKETFKEAVTFANAPAEISEQLDVNDDGEVSSDDRPSDYDKRMGDKKVERGASGTMVAFDKASTTMSKGSGVDVFSGTKDGDTGEVKRPWLFKKGQKLFNGGDAIKNRIANLRGELKGRADSYKVAARSAWDVMTEDGVQPGRVVAAYRDYLRQEASADERRSKPQYTEAQRKAMRLEAMDAAKYVLDTMTPPKKGDAYRLPVGRRKEIAKATKKFFEERFVVTAESPSDRVSNRIDLDELNKMISATKKVVDLARKPDQDEAKLFNENNIISFTRRVKGEDKPAHVRADDLMKWGRKQRLTEEEFTEQSDFSNDNADDQYITDLMSGITAVMDSGFVRKKMPTKLNMKGKIESFADGIPPSLRLATTTQGKREAQREANAQKGAERLRKMGPEAVGKAEESKRELALAEVADEQSAGDGAGPEMAGATRDAQPEGFPEGMPGFPAQGEVRKSRETLRARMEANGELNSADPREAITVPGGEKKSARDSVVPSETERQRETDDFGHKVAEDEFSDQRYRSRVEGFKPDANLPRPKSVLRAYTDANRDAAEIVKALNPVPEGKEVVQAPGALGRPAEGFAMIEARLRAAARPTEGGGLLGGMHFILPVLKVLNGDKLGTYDFSPEEAVKATELRARAAQAILDSKVVGPQRVRMAKELATAVAAERITEDNANTALQRIAQAGKTQAAPEVAAQEAPKSQAKPSGAGRKLNAQSNEPTLDAKLTSVLAERGITVSPAAMEGMPLEDRISLVSRTLQVDADQTMAPDVARFVSWMVIGSDFYDRVEAGIAGSQMEKDIMARVDRDPRQSMYTPVRKRKEIVRRAVEQLLTYGFYKKYAQQGTLPQKLLALVKEAARYVVEALGGVPFRTLQAEADQLVDGILSGEIKLARPTRPGAVLMDPKKAFAEDQHAANIVYGLTEGGGFALTGSLAYAAQGTVYRPAGLPIHDLDLTTNLSQKAAEARLTRLYPQAHLVRSFGGMGSFVTTYVVPPKGHTISGVVVDNGAIKAYTVRKDGATVGRYEHAADGTETQTGKRATVVDLIGDNETDHATMTIPTAFGEKRIPVSRYRDAMTEKLLYARDKDITDFANFVPFDRKLNAQDARTPRDTPASPEEIAKAKAWMNKVLPKVRVEFEKLTGYSGEFIEAENLVKISTTAAAGVMQTAYHEGLHAFFAGLAKNPEARRVLMSIVGNDNSVTVKRLQALLHKYPAAQKQLVDGEERLAYAFQFWAAGKLQLPVGPAKGFFAKLRKFFRQVAGLIKDEEKAADIFQAFNDGKLGDPSTAGKVLNDILAQGTWTKKNLKRLDGLMQRVRQLIMPAEEILMRAPSAEAKALARQLFTNPGDDGSAGMREGLLNAQRTVTTKEMNRFANAIAGLDDKDMANVAKLLEAKTPLNEIPYAPYLKAVKEIRQQLKDFHTYMQSSEMEMGTVKDDYFPRVWSLTKLIDDREGFVKMLMDNYPERLAEIAGAANLRNTKHGKLLDGAVEMDNKAAAEEITNYLIKRNGTDGKVATQREDGVLAPYFAAGEKREFAWIETQKSEPWQNKNLIGIMTGYLHEGVRSAEYTRRFGRKGEHLDASLRTIEAELTNHARAELAKGEFKDQKAANAWVTRQMRGIRQATGAMEGSLGKDISDRMRKFNSWMMVYQNVRLLPLTLFASVVDPMGMIARGATMREAFEAFQRGIQEVFRGWADLFRQEPKGALSDKWTKLAEHIGAVDAAILSHHASEEYSSTYLSHGAKQINDAFFKINGMEAWNRGMRVGAVKSAAAFIARHKALPDVHSQRWLTELGLTPDQITLDGEGNLITDMQDLVDQTGVSKTEAKRQIDAIHAALNRWTLSAVLTPNAAQRPAWSSDPHYSLFFHLKQFSYSFHQTILKRAVKEMNYGNMGPIAAFAGYIPVMIASDVMKGLIVGGGTLPNHMQGMDLGDWVMHGLERSGTLGIGAIGVDASQDMFSVFGPGVEQLVDGITEPIADTTLRAMPLNPLVRAMAE